ncbi:MAG: hypothetical protein CMO81_03710 [Waddliaceae bacterium]|nr:hypothetical protein [Waddliaceae bacterium]
MSTEKEKLTLSQALILIFLSTVVVSGSATLVWLYFIRVQEQRSNDPAYEITEIEQRSRSSISLPSAYLAEIMNLSVDKSSNLYRFDTRLARQELKKSPYIKAARVWKLEPGRVFVDYIPREPLAFLIDYQDVLMDRSGVLMPQFPCYGPLLLPEIRLGLSGFSKENGGKWNQAIENSRLDLAFDILDLCKRIFPSSRIQRIDVAQAEAKSYGERQVIVMIDEEFLVSEEKTLVMPRTLRLNVRSYYQELHDYLVLSQHLKELELKKAEASSERFYIADELVIDLRIPQLAYIEKIRS